MSERVLTSRCRNMGVREKRGERERSNFLHPSHAQEGDKVWSTHACAIGILTMEWSSPFERSIANPKKKHIRRAFGFY